MTRDLKLYDEEEPDKKEKFESIFENEDDLNYQRQLRFLLQHIGFDQCIDKHVNKYYGILEGLENVKLNLTDLGLVPPDSSSHKDSKKDEDSDKFSSHSSFLSSNEDSESKSE